jgi:hypothetical protein
MTVGLPGAGIGGLFYLVATITLPIRHAWRVLRGQPTEVEARDIVRALLLAVGILAGIWVAGWLLGIVMVRVPGASGGDWRTSGQPGVARNAVRVAMLLAGFATLTLVLGAVEVARLVVRRGTAPVMPDESRILP